MAACRRRIGCTPRREGSGRLPDQWHEARAIIDYELISSSPGATYQVDFEVRGVPHVAVNVSQRDDYELLTVAEGSPRVRDRVIPSLEPFVLI